MPPYTLRFTHQIKTDTLLLFEHQFSGSTSNNSAPFQGTEHPPSWVHIGLCLDQQTMSVINSSHGLALNDYIDHILIYFSLVLISCMFLYLVIASVHGVQFHNYFSISDVSCSIYLICGACLTYSTFQVLTAYFLRYIVLLYKFRRSTSSSWLI